LFFSDGRRILSLFLMSGNPRPRLKACVLPLPWGAGQYCLNILAQGKKVGWVTLLAAEQCFFSAQLRFAALSLKSSGFPPCILPAWKAAPEIFGVLRLKKILN
jgi:hypothetical protein